jgi:hypothetical protein
MITAWWIFCAFSMGGCAGLLLAALLRTTADRSPDALAPAECRKLRLALSVSHDAASHDDSVTHVVAARDASAPNTPR